MKPEAVGLSASRLARLDEVMKRRYVDSGRLPGMLTMVYRRGKLAHTGCRDRWIWNATSPCARIRSSASTR